MREAHDHSTLKWIRGELDELIGQARRALEEFVEGQGDKQLLEECIAQLHQVRGTLQLMQLYGAAMLAEEMELVAGALRDGTLRRQDDAAEALMLGLVHLPDYLEKLEGGSRDIPLLILPMLNELRATRDAALLSEVAVFVPDLEQRLAPDTSDGEANTGLSDLIRRLRLNYHKGLLNWFRERDVDAGLSGISEVLEEVERQAGTEPVKRLFRAGRAISEGLREGSIKTGIATKELFGALDRELKRIIDVGEGPVAESPANELLKNFLYYIASASSENPLISSVRKEFGLENGLLNQAEIDQQRAGLQTLSGDLLESLRSAIGADLTTIKDGLDLFIRGQSSDMERILALEEPMRKVADTLGMIGQGALRERLKRQADQVAEHRESGQTPDEQSLMAMAGDILFIEKSLENLATLGHPRFAPTGPDSGLQDLPQGEFEKLVDSVMHEAQVDMARNKETIINFIEEPENKGLLEAVPSRFRSIAGAFKIMNLEQVAQLLEGVSDYVDSALLGGDTIPPTEQLNTFADAITAIEYFMEAVTEGRGVQTDILDIANQSLNQLGVQSESAFPVSAVGKDLLVEKGSKPSEVPAKSQAEEEGAETETKAEAGTAVEADTPPVLEKPSLDEVEPEILEIFIEEAKEELGVILDYLPRWQRNQDDQDALTTFRRSFHTLKGSGRLVGALTIGELAWSMENLLNRVIDETVEVSPDILAILSETVEVLPGLIECQESGRSPDVDVQPIMERALALASSSSVALSPAQAAIGEESDKAAGDEIAAETEEVEEGEAGSQPMADVVPFPGAETTLPSETEDSIEPDSAGLTAEAYSNPPSDSEPSTAPIRMEPTLLDIFASETRGHIDNLRRFVETCRRDPLVCDLGKSDIPRTLHTLHGSADMAGVKPIAEISSALETYANDLKGGKKAAGEKVLELIQRSAAAFDGVLDAINVSAAELPDWQGLVREIETQREFARSEAEPVIDEVMTAENIEGDIGETPEDQVEQKDVSEFGRKDDIETALEQIDQPETASREETEQTSESQPPDAVEVASETGYFEMEGDPELTEIFLEEARELHDAIESTLQTWRQNAKDPEPVSDLQRTLHTLKGGARLAGAMPMGDLSHAFESLLTELEYGGIEATPKVLDLAQAVSDRLAEQIDDIGKGAGLRRSDDLIRSLEKMFSTDGSEERAAEPATAAKKKKKKAEESPDIPQQSEAVAASELGPEATEETTQEEPERVQAEPVATAAVSFGVEEVKPAQPPARTQREHIRVRSDLLDRLVNNAGEVSIYRARLEQQNGALEFNLSELEQTVDRLRGQLRKLEIETEAQILFRYEKDKDEGQEPEESFDPLELDRFSTMQQLSRSLLETVNDLTNINDFLDDLNKETETLLLQQARVSTDLQDGLLRTRMVPFSQLVPRLHRVVRQTAGSLGKEAKFEVYGAEGELDRGILDRMIGPLEHVLRNAVSHGIESVEARREAGKEAAGHIAMYLAREGNDVILTVTDDGGGIKIDLIRRRAIEKGLLDAHAEVPDSDVLPFVLEHGFSTKGEVTQISGRGVGLDVVVKEVKQLGGSLDITSKPGQGTSFIIRLPLTLAISDALLVELGEEVYAIPHTSIEGVVRVARDDLLEYYEGREPFFSYSEHDYLVRYLGSLLNVGQLNLSEQRKWYPLLLVRAGEHRVALQVDGLLGNRQIVVKSVGPQISTIRWISGGTILGDGRVALIVDVTALVRMDAAHTIPVREGTEQSVQPGLGRTVMVVDDSITVRKVTGRVLERHGMHVVTAKDGVDALAQLQESRPDLMLLDIEMPRMDGYELARHMRNTEDLRAIPIIMITSRSGEKHRNLAMELGVKRYLGKPYQEAELLDNIYSVLDEVGR